MSITDNRQNIFINFHQDFKDRMHSEFLQGQADKGLFFWNNHSRETGLSRQEEKRRALNG